MIKEIKYNGYTANPSDYESPDGDLATSIGLIQEDASLRPILPPVEICAFNPSEKILYIHKTDIFTHYIIYNHDNAGLYWADKDSPTSLNFISAIPNLYSISTIGNILVALLNDTTFYIIWNKETYINLGERPPFLTIDFKLSDNSTNDISENYEITIDESEKGAADAWSRAEPHRNRYSEHSSFISDISNALWATILAKTAELNNENIFHQPFFIRYAYRVLDRHFWASAPILMLPFTGPLMMQATIEEGTVEPLKFSMKGTIYAGKIYYRFVSPPIEKLNLWKDIVSHIDIFISAPIYTYDQSKKIWKYENGSTMNMRYNHISILDTTENVIKYDDKNSNDEICKYFVIPPTSDHLHLDSKIDDKITNTALFYKVAEISVSDLVENKDVDADGVISRRVQGSSKKLADNNFKPLYLAKNTLGSLLTRETLKDDYLSHHNIVAKAAFDYNSRLHLANIIRFPFASFPIRSAIQYRKPAHETSALKDATIICYSVTLIKNGVVTHSQLSVEDYFPENTELSIHSVDSIDMVFPRYLYYPDPDATEIKISVLFLDDGSDVIKARIYTLPLSTHPSLNGAYYYRGLNPDAPLPDYEDTEVIIPILNGKNCYFEGNKLYSSDVNNPFCFNPDNIRSVSTGEIFAICSAAKPLSQGQFGQFPLYAFTSQGVWALSPSSTGTFEPAQPITRDVAINPDSITPIDSAVLFATDRGIMHISGSTVQCISDSLNTADLSTIADLPKADKLIEIFNSKADESEQITLDNITLLPFDEFLRGCRMVYDYINQHIIVYNASVRYAYLFSLKSKSWGMMRSDIVDNVNSYPEALAMADGAKLVDFSKSNVETTTSLIITRPFKMDDPNLFKTINTIIQRGMFRSTHVQQVLYGSNDLIHWHTVWSSVDKIMRGFRGTPYKAYRLALVCKFDKGESIYGCTVVFEPRMTNQIR